MTEQTFDEEEDDEELSEIDVSGDEMMEDEDSEGEEVDIRALVGKPRQSGQSPPAKKQRQK